MTLGERAWMYLLVRAAVGAIIGTWRSTGWGEKAMESFDEMAPWQLGKEKAKLAVKEEWR